MEHQEIEEIKQELKAASAPEIVRRAVDRFGSGEISLASSFGAEDQVLTDMLVKTGQKISVFTLDTGRLPQETYDVIEATRKHYQIKIEVLFPETQAVEMMEKEFGPNLFYDSIGNRKKCCGIRKVEPLKKRLATLKAWICGLRREQSLTRQKVRVIEWDEAFGLIKINPLAEWREAQVWDYLNEYRVPYNLLHDQGYPSIGCAPCTRAIKPGEDIRAGRWWWETLEQKECGLHLKDGKLSLRRVRKDV
ncbi:MAG: phosphoadenylyl-sulfate reductase [Elusimicrobia bacterium]|nr:phosphoadenylyl-sulfate reductase [Elusimicrobiota bacterium]